jgi:hypothetical protein
MDLRDIGWGGMEWIQLAQDRDRWWVLVTTERSSFDPRQRQEDFSSNLFVHTSSGTHPASYPMGTRVLSQGIKRGRGVTLTTHPHLVLRS